MKDDETSADTCYQQGMDHFIHDRLDRAIAEFSKAIELEPQHQEALRALSMSCFHQKDIESAVLYGERLRDLAPEDAMAYTSLSMFYQAQGRIQDAEDAGAMAAKFSGSSED